MKKIIFAAGFLCLSAVSFAQSDLAVTASTNALTSVSQKIGFSSLAVDARGDRYTYTITADDMMIDNETVNLNNTTFTASASAAGIEMNYQSVKLFLPAGTKDVTVSVSGSAAVSLAKLAETSFKKAEMKNIKIALILLNEIADKTSQRTSAVAGRSTGVKHGTWFVINGGFSSSTSTANTQSEVNAFLLANPNCSLYGALDTSCLWDNHICTSTQYFHCK